MAESLSTSTSLLSRNSFAMVPVSSITFKNDYFNQLAVANKNVIEAVENLREKYPWLPTQKALATENKRLQTKAEDIFSAFTIN